MSSRRYEPPSPMRRQTSSSTLNEVRKTARQVSTPASMTIALILTLPDHVRDHRRQQLARPAVDDVATERAQVGTVAPTTSVGGATTGPGSGVTRPDRGREARVAVGRMKAHGRRFSRS